MATAMSNAYRTDLRVRYAAEAMQRAAPGPLKHLASALDRSIKSAHREKTGHEYTLSHRFIEFVEAMAENHRTDAYPVIAEAIAVATQAQVRRQTTEHLVAELFRLDALEHAQEAEENRAGMDVARADDKAVALRASARADIDEAATQLYRAAVKRELADRGVDPYAGGAT